MGQAHDRGRLDWLVELAGASAPALAAAFAAAKVAPVNGWTASIASLIAGVGVFGAAYVAMRLVPAEARHLDLRHFHALVLEDELLLDQPVEFDELLLDQPIEFDELLLDQPLIAGSEAIAELLLDDPLPVPAIDSRVVQLFAEGRMPNAGQLRDRIDRHLADAGKQAPSTDASDALSEALAELRRSLRQA